MPAASQTWRGATEVRRERMLSKFLVDEGLAMLAVCPLPPFEKRMAGRVRVGGVFSFRLRIFALPPTPDPSPPLRGGRGDGASSSARPRGSGDPVFDSGCPLARA